jgi:hypothetical protein
MSQTRKGLLPALAAAAQERVKSGQSAAFTLKHVDHEVFAHFESVQMGKNLVIDIISWRATASAIAHRDSTREPHGGGSSALRKRQPRASRQAHSRSGAAGKRTRG